MMRKMEPHYDVEVILSKRHGEFLHGTLSFAVAPWGSDSDSASYLDHRRAPLEAWVNWRSNVAHGCRRLRPSATTALRDAGAGARASLRGGRLAGA